MRNEFSTHKFAGLLSVAARPAWCDDLLPQGRAEERRDRQGVARDPNLGHQLLFPSANWCPIFASWATQRTSRTTGLRRRSTPPSSLAIRVLFTAFDLLLPVLWPSTAFYLTFHCLLFDLPLPVRRLSFGLPLPAHCDDTAFCLVSPLSLPCVLPLPLPCVSTAFVAKTLPLSCVATVLMAETLPSPCGPQAARTTTPSPRWQSRSSRPRCRCLFTACPLAFRCLFTAFPLAFHCLITAFPLAFHCLFTALH